MVRRLFVLAFACLAVTLGVPRAYACSCLPRPTFEEAVRDANVAFTGTVTDSLGAGRYRVRIAEMLKGGAADTVTLRAETEAEAATCATTLPLGPVAYAGNTLTVNQCSTRWSGAEAVALGAPAETPGPSGGVPAWAVAVAVAGVAATAIAYLRNRAAARRVHSA